MAVFNSGVSLRNFLQTDENPMGVEEFMIFWESLTLEEQIEFRRENLNI